jgi:hypothetical protein
MQRWIDLSLNSLHILVKQCDDMLSYEEVETLTASTICLCITYSICEESWIDILLECTRASYRNKDHAGAFLIATKIQIVQDSTDTTNTTQDCRFRINRSMVTNFVWRVKRYMCEKQMMSDRMLTWLWNTISHISAMVRKISAFCFPRVGTRYLRNHWRRVQGIDIQ